jgi:hypothetical protein
MKVLGVVFDYGNKERYAKLVRVWRKSIELNCPSAEIHVAEIAPPTETKRKIGLSSNWHKFKLWQRFIAEQPDGEHVILMDVDMVVLQDLAPAFDRQFDIGATRRTKANWPYNGGVVFVRVNQRTKAFLEQWAEIDERMYRDEKFHAPYSHKYKGQNQSSFGYMLEHNTTGAEIVDFPCAVWNACNEDWSNIDDDTRVIHLKSQLRLVALGEQTGMPSKMRRAVNEFRKYEKAAAE